MKEIELKQNLAGEGFMAPPAHGENIFIQGEIISAHGFEANNLYCYYQFDLPETWKILTKDYWEAHVQEPPDISDLTNRLFGYS